MKKNRTTRLSFWRSIKSGNHISIRENLTVHGIFKNLNNIPTDYFYGRNDKSNICLIIIIIARLF